MPGPGYGFEFPQLEEQAEFFNEKGIVVLKLQTEERIGIGERTSSGDNLGASSGNEIKSGEFLENTHRIVRTKHGDSTGEADFLGA